MAVSRQRTMWLPCFPACLFLPCQAMRYHQRPDWQRPCRVEGRGRLGWRMDVLSIKAALAGGLRSWHVVVRERWPVRSQHSLTTPDSSSRQEQPRICLCGDSRQNGFFHSGQRAMCWPGEKGCKGASQDEWTFRGCKEFGVRRPCVVRLGLMSHWLYFFFFLLLRVKNVCNDDMI